MLMTEPLESKRYIYLAVSSLVNSHLYHCRRNAPKVHFDHALLFLYSLPILSSGMEDHFTGRSNFKNSFIKLAVMFTFQSLNLVQLHSVRCRVLCSFPSLTCLPTHFLPSPVQIVEHRLCSQ